jgi:hypothetical protein
MERSLFELEALDNDPNYKLTLLERLRLAMLRRMMIRKVRHDPTFRRHDWKINKHDVTLPKEDDGRDNQRTN